MKKKKEKMMSPEDLAKLEIARDLGLEEKILSLGWAELTAEESGRIGGILSGRERARRAQAKKETNHAVCGSGPELRSVDAAGSADLPVGGFDSGGV